MADIDKTSETIEDIKNASERVEDANLTSKKDEEGEGISKDKRSYFAHFFRQLLISIAAIIIFAVFFIRFWVIEKQSIATQPATIVIMGDSIFANTADDTSVANQLSYKLDTDIVDLSFGGSCMSYIDKDARLDNNTDAYCMAALTQAIIAEDFRYQANANVRLNATEYFEDRIAVLETIDFSQVDILIIDYLLNDYQIAVPVECGSNQYDEYTFVGAYRSVLTQLKDNYPELRIIIVAPVKTWYLEEHIPSTEMDIGGGTVDVYIEAQKQIAGEMDVEWISLFELYDDAVKTNPQLLKDESGNKLEMYQAFTYDNIHPNDIARELIAEYLYEYLADGE